MTEADFDADGIPDATEADVAEALPLAIALRGLEDLAVGRADLNQTGDLMEVDVQLDGGALEALLDALLEGEQVRGEDLGIAGEVERPLGGFALSDSAGVQRRRGVEQDGAGLAPLGQRESGVVGGASGAGMLGSVSEGGGEGVDVDVVVHGVWYGLVL